MTTAPPGRKPLPRPQRFSPVWRLADMVRHLAVRLATTHRHLYSLGPCEVPGADEAAQDLACWVENANLGLHPGVSLVMQPGVTLRFPIPKEHAGRFSAQLAVLPAVRLMAQEEVRFEVSFATPSGAIRGVAERSVRAGPPRRQTVRTWVHQRVPRGGGELLLRVVAREGAPPLSAVWINPAIFSRARADRPPDFRLLRAALGSLRPRDLSSAARRLERFLRSVSPQTYRRELTPAERDRLRSAAALRHAAPRLSLLFGSTVLPIDALLATLRSIRAQSYESWEVLFCPARQSNESAVRAVADLVDGDPRLRFLEAPEYPGRAAAMNAALRAASGDFVGALEPGDELPPDALYRLSMALEPPDAADLAYSDEEVPTGFGDYDVPVFKPGWAPESALSYPYVGRLCFVRKSLALSLGGWREDTLAAEEYDLVLRAHAAGARIAHVPRVLYRRAERMDWFNEPRAVAARRVAVAGHLRQLDRPAQVVDAPEPARLRLRFPIQGSPLVSIVVPTRDKLALLRRCLQSIEGRTVYRPFEIVIVDNDSHQPRTQAFLARCGHRVVRHPGEFNFSAINNHGARAARGEFLLFLNNDTEVVTPGWLMAMLEWAQLPQVGCVGAKLLFPDGRLQHVGIALRDGTAEHPFYRQWPGSQSRWTDTEVVRNCSAVTAACMMVRRSLFEELDGFDEGFPVNYQDVDFCLRLSERGRRHVYTPHAVLVHRESSSRPAGVLESERQRLRDRFGALLWNDPYWPGPGRYGLVDTPED